MDNIANAKPKKVNVYRDREWHRLMQYIKSAQKQLEDGSAVPDYNIRKESSLHMMLRVASGSTYVLVKTPGNTTLVVQVELSDTVLEVKEKVQDMEGIPMWEHRYILGGRQLEEGRTLAEYGVEKGSTLYLVVWSRLLRGFITVSEYYLPYVAYMRDSASSSPYFYEWYLWHCI